MKNHCKYFDTKCIQEDCGAFLSYRPLTKGEMSDLLAADIPVTNTTRYGMYCLRYKTELVPEFERGKDGKLVRVF